jgi:hypothetical protein
MHELSPLSRTSTGENCTTTAAKFPEDRCSSLRRFRPGLVVFRGGSRCREAGGENELGGRSRSRVEVGEYPSGACAYSGGPVWPIYKLFMEMGL